jgi:hypothetical protein
MDVSQRNAGKLEQGSDPRLSSLQRYVAAMGGSVRIVIDLPNEEPIDLVTPPRTTAPRHRRASCAVST